MAKASEPYGASHMSVFPLKLHKTYYKMGFFNVPVAYDQFVSTEERDIKIYLGDAQAPIVGYINRTANSNRTARIMGGGALRDWFQAHYQVMSVINIEFRSPTEIYIGIDF